MMDDRRFAELSELMLDGELEAGDAAELRAHLEADPAAVAALRTAAQDHVLARAALRPSPAGQLALRTRYLLESLHPASRTVAAHAVLQRMDRRRRWATVRHWGMAAAAALLFLLLVPGVRALLLGPALAPDERSPLLVEVHGAVQLESGLMLHGGERIGLNATVVSGPGAGAALVWKDGTRVAVVADTTITRLPGPGQRLQLDRGTVVVHAAHRGADEALEIVCPDATARVVGTAFTATVADGHSRLAVSEGLVRWGRPVDGVWSLVGAGQSVDAVALPLARPFLLPNDQLAALRTALADGREPWAGSWTNLQSQAVRWRTQAVALPETIDVPAYGLPGPGHSAARTLLYMHTQPMLGLALAGRLGGDAEAARAARPWLEAATKVVLSGHDADVLCCDMLAIYGLQTADLLRAQPGWGRADDDLIERWITRTLAPPAQRLAGEQGGSAKLRGIAAMMTIAAWHGDQNLIVNLMEQVRAVISEQLAAKPFAALLAGAEKNQQAFQCLTFALLCADIARIAGDDTSPPPAPWGAALQAYGAAVATAPATSQLNFFFRALAGPGPWRLPEASSRAQGADPTVFTYCWYFPTLVAHDVRWGYPAADR
jgi:hypothetical protein